MWRGCRGSQPSAAVRRLTDEEVLLSDPQNLLLFGGALWFDFSLSLKKTAHTKKHNNNKTQKAETKTTNKAKTTLHLFANEYNSGDSWE